MRLVLAGGLLRGRNVAGRQGQERAALDLAEGHVGVRHEVVELVHEVLGYEVRPADLV